VRPIVKISPAWREGARLLNLALSMQTRAAELAIIGDRRGASNWLSLSAFVASHAAEHLQAAADSVAMTMDA